ncbi:MAG: glycosyltransferase [Pseudomonadales bacterium]|nr:glycosyltransferase [Pseudomonadales bacterium]
MQPLISRRDQEKGIVFYDFFLVKGGAEAVTLNLCKHLPNADLCVEYSSAAFKEELDSLGVNLRTIGKITTISGWLSIKGLYNFWTKARFLDSYDWVIYSGSNTVAAVHNQTRGRKYLYCHTIPRFAYDLREYYKKRAAWWQYPLFLFLTWYVRRFYESAITKMDLVICNSHNTQSRLKKYIGCDSVVVYPPVDIEKQSFKTQGDYYLSTSRVESFKRVALIVEAFVKMPDKKLIVASGGSDLESLKKLASEAKNITFTGWLEEVDLIDLISNCLATIYIPKDEDFGMSPVESMAAGKPVIGVSEGGMLETILPDITGLLLPAEPEVWDLVNLVQEMTPLKALSMRSNCEKRANLFSREVFIDKIKKLAEIG